MSEAPIMPFFTDAYLADTNHLSAEAHGAYLLLLLYMWRMNGAVLADDDVQLARIARVSKARWKTLRPMLIPFFIIEDGVWRQKRLHQTWLQVQERIAKQRSRALKGVEKRKIAMQLENNDSDAAAAQPSITIIHDPVSKDILLSPAKREEIRQQALQSNYGVAAMLSLPCPHVSYLSPHIQDYRYFTTRCAPKKVEEALRPRLEKAREEARHLLVPMTEEAARAVVARLFRRCPAVKADQKQALIEDYVEELKKYPEDMVLNAVDKVMATHVAAYPPLLSVCISPMAEEWKQRCYIHKQVHALYALL